MTLSGDQIAINGMNYEEIIEISPFFLAFERFLDCLRAILILSQGNFIKLRLKEPNNATAKELVKKSGGFILVHMALLSIQFYIN